MKLFSKLSLLLCLLLAIPLIAQQRPGALRGTVTDAKSGETIPTANIVVFDLTGNQVAGASSDFDGNYNINPLKPGMYNVQSQFVGYAKLRIDSVIVSPNTPTILNFKLQQQSEMLEEVVIVRYDVPLIDKTKSSKITTAQDIQHMAVRDISSVSAQAAGVVADHEELIEVRGARSEGTVYFIDGISVQGNIHLPQSHSREKYDRISENSFLDAGSVPLSTFSSDVDVASYANVRRFLSNGNLPPADAVRIEEMINYFNYDYQNPEKDKTFSVNTELIECPWAPKHRLMKVGINTQQIPLNELPPNNLVFLIDVSGSMMDYNKLPLLKKSLKMMVQNLRDEDNVAIVVYASATGLVLPATSGKKKAEILKAIDQLHAGGSTAGGAGIKLAYETAQENFQKKANNRVILATDGDFNVGISDDDELVKLIEKKRESGVFLSVLGFGAGNYQGSKMEKLADNGNGNYAYIDNLFEAKKVLVEEMGANLNVVAKDTKFQIEFNPTQVQAYRLIGYENRLLEDEDFNDDTKDAGDVGSGHSVTALYEIIPTGQKIDSVAVKNVDDLKYQIVRTPDANYSAELATVKIRHKKPGEATSILEEHIISSTVQEASADLYFIAALAQFGMLLRNSDYKGKSSYQTTLALAKQGKGDDNNGYRGEFVKLVKMAEELDSRELVMKE